LVPDPRNARAHTPTNIGLVVDSLQEVGAGRSIVIDEGNVVLAGNGVFEAAAEAGFSRVHVVDADGEEIIAVRRRGLTAEQKTRLALFDNRAGEHGRWNPQVLAEIEKAGLLAGMFDELTLAAILASKEDEPAVPRAPQPPIAFETPDQAVDYCCPGCALEWAGDPRPGDLGGKADA